MTIRRILTSLALSSATMLLNSACRADTKREHDAFQDVEKEARETLRAVRSYAFDRKEEYQKKLEATLAKLDRQSDILKRKAARAGEAARRKYEHELAELQPVRDKVQAALKKVKRATPEAWE